MEFLKHTFVINLDRRPDRLDGFVQRWQNIGLPFTRWPATDGTHLPKHLLDTSPLSKGEVGCAISHAAIYAHCISKSIDLCCVFEDDADFAIDFLERVARIESTIPGDWEHIQLGGLFAPREAIGRPISDCIFRTSPLAGTHAYIINRIGMQKALPRMRALDRAADGVIDDCIVHDGLKSFVMLPMPCGAVSGHSDIADRLTNYPNYSFSKDRPMPS